MESYAKIKILGKGSFGSAYLCRDNRDKRLVCIKTVNVRAISKKERDSVKLEVQLLKRLNHPNIVSPSAPLPLPRQSPHARARPCRGDRPHPHRAPASHTTTPPQLR
jgi:serine/threonine protein kinase